MAKHSIAPWLTDIVDAAERIKLVLDEATLDEFEADWRKQWLVERGLEIISEASRHLPPEFKAGHPDIPWPKVAGIGNILRHDYGRVAAPILWKLVRDDLPILEHICRLEMTRQTQRPEA